MPRPKKTQVETLSDSESSIEEKPIKKSTKKSIKKKEVVEEEEIIEDELSDIEVDEVTHQDTTHNKPKRQETNPLTPIGELNVEEILNYIIKVGHDTYNPDLKYGCLEIKKKITGQGRKNNNYQNKFTGQNQNRFPSPGQEQNRFSSPGQGQNRYPTPGQTPNYGNPRQNNVYDRNAPRQYQNNNGPPNRKQHRPPQMDNESDIYAD